MPVKSFKFVIKFAVFVIIFFISTNDKKAHTTKPFRHNMTALDMDITDDKKSYIDKKTNFILSTCQSNFDIHSQLGMTNNTNAPLCSKADAYEGACWVQSLGLVDGRHKLRVCNQEPSSQANCVDLANGEATQNIYVQLKEFGETDIGYQGGYGLASENNDCPDISTSINAIGYNYIYEATDSQYKDYDDFVQRFCQPLSENFNPNLCDFPATCPCDGTDCKQNGFIPPKHSTTWKNASQKAKNCYLCLQKYRAVQFYCKKVYTCLQKYKTKSHIYNLATNETTRPFIKKMFGKGLYLCGYKGNTLCGCAKEKLPAGPRHFARIAYKQDVSQCATKEDLQNNPQCNLFESNAYVRQFRNDNIFNSNAECENEKNLLAEYGWKVRGTFFSPRIVVSFGKNERNIQFDSSLLLSEEDEAPADYYYNDPQGTSYNNGHNFVGLPTTNKIIYSHFYPVIYAVGAKFKMLGENNECTYRATGDVAFIMLRLEYNISTNESALVAYKVRFSNSVPSNFDSSGKLLKPDGSFSKFKANSNSQIFQQVKNAKNNARYGRVAVGEFRYSDDPDQNFINKTLEENGDFLIFENIGKVPRPPLKYGYDEGSNFIVSPIVLKPDNNVAEEIQDDKDKTITKLKLQIIPNNLSVFDGTDEFKYDKLLPVATQDLAISTISKNVYDLQDGTVNSKTTASLQDFAFLYFKRFAISYSNPCVFIKNFLNNEKNRYFTTDIPKNANDCADATTIDAKLACYTSATLYEECQGYISCLNSSNSISQCQAEGRIPEIKLSGNENDLSEYQKNTDFRQKVDICVTEGFEFADKISKYSNTRLFGDFGYAPYDYTIRMKKRDNSIFAHTPSKPLTLSKELIINHKDNYQFDKTDIIQMDINYFSDNENNRLNNMLLRLKGVNMKNETTNMPSEITAFDYYASECESNAKICENKLEVKHRQILETFSNLCTEANAFNSGIWDLKPRDVGVDYHVYVPLRCQYIDFEVTGAGGAGMTSTENAPGDGRTNCVVQWWFHIFSGLGFCFKIFGKKICFELPCVFQAFSYNRLPKFDATGSQGATTSGTLDISKLPIFDGYLSITTGARTKVVKKLEIPGYKSEGNERCFTGEEPYFVIGKNHKTWYVQGGTHAYWYKGTNFTASTAFSIPDNRKGVSEVSVDLHTSNVDEFDWSSFYKEKIYNNNLTIEQNTQNIKENIGLLQNNIMTEFYFVTLQLIADAIRNADVLLYKTTQLAVHNVKKKYSNNLSLLLEDYNNKKNIYDQDYNTLQTTIAIKQQKEKKTPPEDTTQETNIINTINGRIETEKNEMNLAKEKYDQLKDIIDNNKYPEDEIINIDVINDSNVEDMTIKNIGNEDVSLKANIQEYLTELNSSINQYKCAFNSNIDNNNTEINTENLDRSSSCLYSEERNITRKNDIIDYIKAETDYENLDVNNKSLLDLYFDVIDNTSELKKNILESLEDITYNNVSVYEVQNVILPSLEQNFLKILNTAMNDNQVSQYHNKFLKLQTLFDKSITHRSLLQGNKTYFVDKFEAEHKDNYYYLNRSLCNCFSYLYNTELCNRLEYNNPHSDTGNTDKQLISSYNEFYNSCKIDTATTGLEKRFFKSLLDNEEQSFKDKLSENVVLSNDNTNYQKFVKDENDNDNNTVNNKTEQYLFRAGRGKSPIDCRVNRLSCSNSNCPCFDNDHQDSGKYIHYCYLDRVQFVAHDHSLSEIGFYGTVMNTRRHLNDTISYAQCLNKYMVNNQCITKQGNASRLAYDTDHRLELTHYTHKNEYSNDGPGSVDTRYFVHGFKNKLNTSIGGGGSYYHNGATDDANSPANLEGTGAGGSGNIKMDVTKINIEQSEYNGKNYPVLNNDGTKKIGGNKPDYQCSAKCPPVYVKYNDFTFYFPEIKNTYDVDVICEYTGEPEDDMEAIVGKSYAPKKCYITTQNVPGVGDVKGRIIINLNEYCPIAKCQDGMYNFDVGNQNAEAGQLPYDRKTTLCKPKTKYGSDSVKSSWYYNMMFDKNIYSSMSYTGTKNTYLSASILQQNKLKSYIIAGCAKTDYAKYYNDDYSLMNNLKLNCSENGFWSLSTYNKTNNVYTDEELGYDEEDEKKYPDMLRNREYNNNNSPMSYTEFLVKDSRYVLDKQLGQEFNITSSTPTSHITTGNAKLDSNGGELGRVIFKNKVYCPTINADIYDFDSEYSGNANWSETKEGSSIYGNCKTNTGNIYIENKSGKPHRVCKTNGMWGPVVNPCYKGCEPTTDDMPPYTKWQINSSDLNRINEEDYTLVVYGNCAGNYLNSQDYYGNSITGKDYRTCNLKTGIWGEVHTGNCNDKIISKLEDNYEGKTISVPLARVLKYSSNNEYAKLVADIENRKYKLEDKTKYIQGLYIAFEPNAGYSDDFNTKYYKVYNEYTDIQLKEVNIDSDEMQSYTHDSKNHLLFDNSGAQNYFMIKLSNIIYPKAFDVYMLAQGNDDRNEFLNIQNWVQNIKDDTMNFTGQWSWKANLSKIKSKGVQNATISKTQQIYKHSALIVFIKKTNNLENDLKHIALFSPYLAYIYANQNGLNYSDYLQDDINIKFRYMFEISNTDLINNEPYPVIVYDGINSSHRLYQFEWENEKNKNWIKTTTNTHHIGDKKCYGKYYGEIEHNTLKHIMYTSEPTNEIQTFGSLFCYDGRIFGYHAFQTNIVQENYLTDKYTKDTLLSVDKNGYNYASMFYNKQKQYFSTLNLTNDYFSDSYDIDYATAKNAYLAGFMYQYWSKFIIPDEQTQQIFIQNYNVATDTHYQNAKNSQVASILEQYSKGNKSKFYRIVERDAEWISGKYISTDSLDNVYDIDTII